jgi:DNA-binding transcriptional LysR family regulator
MKRPKISDLDLRLLRVLDMLLETGSVSLAAEALGVTPSAVSHSLKALRTLMKDPLLVRSGSALQPTAFALATRPALRSALLNLRHILDGVPTFDAASTTRQFSIVMPDFLMPQVLAPVMQEVRIEAPESKVRVWPLGPQSHVALETGELDLVLTAGRNETYLCLDRGMMRSRMYVYKFACIVRKDHPVLRTGVWDAETYATLPHLFVSLSGEPRSVIDDAIDQRGLSRPHVLTLPADGSVEAMVATTDLVATMSEDFCRQAIAGGRVVMLELPFCCPPAEAFLWWHPRYQTDPAHMWWRSKISSTVRHAGIGQHWAPQCSAKSHCPGRFNLEEGTIPTACTDPYLHQQIAMRPPAQDEEPENVSRQ